MSEKPILMVKDIRNFLPHRYPFLLIDRVLEYGSDYVKAIKNVTVNEEFFNGHFPSEPVMPGVLQIEAMAQAGAFLTYDDLKDCKDVDVFFVTIDEVKFRKIVVPGDQLIIEAKLIKKRRDFIWTEATITVDGALACEAKFSAIMKAGGEK